MRGGKYMGLFHSFKEYIKQRFDNELCKIAENISMKMLILLS